MTSIDAKVELDKPWVKRLTDSSNIPGVIGEVYIRNIRKKLNGCFCCGCSSQFNMSPVNMLLARLTIYIHLNLLSLIDLINTTQLDPNDAALDEDRKVICSFLMRVSNISIKRLMQTIFKNDLLNTSFFQLPLMIESHLLVIKDNTENIQINITDGINGLMTYFKSVNKGISETLKTSYEWSLNTDTNIIYEELFNNPNFVPEGKIHSYWVEIMFALIGIAGVLNYLDFEVKTIDYVKNIVFIIAFSILALFSLFKVLTQSDYVDKSRRSNKETLIQMSWVLNLLLRLQISYREGCNQKGYTVTKQFSENDYVMI